jgi:hypothetical protein
MVQQKIEITRQTFKKRIKTINNIQLIELENLCLLIKMMDRVRVMKAGITSLLDQIKLSPYLILITLIITKFQIK